MKVRTLCSNCKQATLEVEPGPQAEFSARCPVCGPVFGTLILTTEEGEIDRTKTVSV